MRFGSLFGSKGWVERKDLPFRWPTKPGRVRRIHHPSDTQHNNVQPRHVHACAIVPTHTRGSVVATAGGSQEKGKGGKEEGRAKKKERKGQRHGDVPPPRVYCGHTNTCTCHHACNDGKENEWDNVLDEATHEDVPRANMPCRRT